MPVRDPRQQGGCRPFPRSCSPRRHEGEAQSACLHLSQLLGIPKITAPVSNIVYFDLETQRSAEEVGGWHRVRDMRMSVGVTYSTARRGYRIYGECQVNELVEELRRADLVVGFNHLRFDYEVLYGYTILDLTQVPALDLLVELQRRLNHRLTLDSVASATLGTEKTADGLQALRWYKEGRLLEIAEYCCYDVKITKMLHEFGRDRQQVFYNSRTGQVTAVPVAW